MNLARERDDIALISTDSSIISGGLKFRELYPERYFEVGIAEQNGVAFASGLASCGLVPYIATYAGFLTMRACEQMRTFCAYPRLKVRFAGANGGMLGGNREGVTHQFFEDIGILQSIPGFTIVAPSDGGQVKKAVEAVADVDGPAYIRIGSGKEPKIHSDDDIFELGKASVLLDNGSDVALFSYGFVLDRALDAAERLKARGIGAVVVEVPTIKPMDVETITATLKRTSCAVTVEDHNIIGGLGSAIMTVSGERFPSRIGRVGLRDTWPESGEPSALLDEYGLSIDDIVGTAEETLRLN